MDTDKLMGDWFRHFVPGKTALIVVDKQNAYMDEAVLADRSYSLSEMGKANFVNLEHFIEAARAAGVPVIWTQMYESVAMPQEPVREKMLRDVAEGYVVIDSRPGNAQYAFHGRVQPLDNETIIPKEHYDAFSNPSLHQSLQALGVESVILCGGFASRCVVATSFGANTHDYHLMIASDAVIDPASFEPEIPTTSKIIDAILGYHAPVAEIITNWQ
ncbi:MAG: isochorismatase [Candidatus Saccharibacteria bacterium]|nr:isochorismatase [Candidatus Saccharibacteria bacterium]